MNVTFKDKTRITMPGISITRVAIGLGIASGRWTPVQIESKLLYWGKVSEITGGTMPNKVTGATDHIDIGGSAGTYTFQVPNTAAYIAADTDYIWFKTDTTPRTTTEAELVGYDLPRTPVKYDDDTPNLLREIIILKAGETLTASERDFLFAYMWLPIMWDNAWNDYGHSKDNRSPIEQKLWTPESVGLPEQASIFANWQFNGDATDESGNGYDLQNVNATLTTDRNNIADKAFAFVTNALMQKALFTELSALTSEFTVMIGFKINAFANYVTIIANTDLGAYSDGWALYYHPTGAWRFCVQGSNTNYVDLPFTDTASWHTIICSWKKTVSDSKNLKISIDGGSEITGNFNNVTMVPYQALTSGKGFSDVYYNGKIDSIVIWKKELTTAQKTEAFGYYQ